MANEKTSIQVQNLNADTIQNGTVEVMYQKLGNRWFAFSQVGDEVFVGSIDSNELQDGESREAQDSDSNESGNMPSA